MEHLEKTMDELQMSALAHYYAVRIYETRGLKFGFLKEDKDGVKRFYKVNIQLNLPESLEDG